MGGNTFSHTAEDTGDIQYALRITFGIVHGVILTLFSFGLVLFFPSLSQLLNCIVIPLISFALAIFCNGCIEYLSQSTLTVARILKTAWIPPLGVFCANLVILPLELMPSFVFTTIVVNFILSTILPVYAAKDIQGLHSKSSGVSSPT